MRLEIFRGQELHKLVRQVRRTLGPDAMIVRTRTRTHGGQALVEVVAAPAPAVEAFKQKLDGGRAAARRVKEGRPRIGPYVIGLVGPTGAGKTSTTVKIALHPRALGRRKVGLITLDTFRPGAVEELQTYAEIASLPLEVLYNSQELPGALQRLRACDVIVVDTPGRSPRFDSEGAQWQTVLEAISADEVHLVLPAGLRLDVAVRLREALSACGPTHALYTKLDETGEDGLAELAQAVDLPVRWIADGQDLPGDLQPAGPRILASLGLTPDDSAPPLQAAG